MTMHTVVDVYHGRGRVHGQSELDINCAGQIFLAAYHSKATYLLQKDNCYMEHITETLKPHSIKAGSVHCPGHCVSACAETQGPTKGAHLLESTVQRATH